MLVILIPNRRRITYFYRHPGLLAPANLSNEPIPSAHDAEAPPGGDNESPGRSLSGSPSKARPEPGTVEWARQRKDNHKEVERRRRGNINEGINELARIIPNGQGDKAKGAVLARAVQYVRQMKENEQRTVEKWTMEKLMHDQMVVELQMKCNEAEEKWKEEKTRREELEGEVARLKKLLGETEEDELDEDEDEDDRPTKRQRVA
jgi:transcriptional regulator CBF1